VSSFKRSVLFHEEKVNDWECWEQTVNKLRDNLWASLHASRKTDTEKLKFMYKPQQHTRLSSKGLKIEWWQFIFSINTSKGRKDRLV